MAEARPAPSPARVSLWFWALLVLFIGGAIGVNQLLFGSRSVAPPPGWLTIRPPRDVHALVIEGDTVWTGGKEGLWTIDRISGRAINVKDADGRDYPMTWALAIEPQTGTLWIGHDAGVAVVPPGRTLAGGNGDRICAFAWGREGMIWAGGLSGLDGIDPKTGERGLITIGGLDPMVNAIFIDYRRTIQPDPRFPVHTNPMWLGSYTAPRGGLTVYNGREIQYFTVANGLPHNNINAIVPVGDTEVWVATGFLDRGGVAVFTVGDTGWVTLARTVSKADGLAGEKARSLCVTRDGTIWVGSEYDGLAYYRNGHWRVLTEQDGLCNNEIKTMAQDAEGNLWLGTRDGVMRLTAAALTALP